MPYYKKPVYGVDEFLSTEEVSPKHEIIWRTERVYGRSQIEIAAKAINVISAVNVRGNARQSMQIAVDLAGAGSRVLLINGYSGPAALRQDLLESLRLTPLDEAARKNLRILQSPMGDWNPYLADAEILRTGYCPQWEGKADVIILNSFEFTTMDARERKRLSQKLIYYQLQHEITVIVFTQALRRTMCPGMACHGPIGNLVTPCATLSRICSDMVYLQDDRILPAENSTENVVSSIDDVIQEAGSRDDRSDDDWSEADAAAHENYEFETNTHNKISCAPAESAPECAVIDEQLAKEQLEEYERPWSREVMTGTQLLEIARSKRLQEYYRDNPYRLYRWGEQPTERQLERQERDRYKP